MKNHKKIVSMVQIGLFAAVLTVLSQISIPLPSGIPITLQTFAVALSAYTLGWKRGTLSVLVFLTLGAIGIPVFANFTGGIAKFAGVTGGYLWGFLLLAMFCGLGAPVQFKKRNVYSILSCILLSTAGLIACHSAGILQFTLVSGSSPLQSFLTASAPYLLKDALSLAAAYSLAGVIRTAMRISHKNNIQAE